MIFDITKGMAHKAPLTKWVLMDLSLHPYLNVLLVAVLYQTEDAIRVPSKGKVISYTKNKFKNFRTNKGAKNYNNYGTLVQDYCLHMLFEKLAD